MENGGADKFNLDALEQLGQRGWECQIITTAPSRNPALAKFEELATLLNLPEESNPARFAQDLHHFIAHFEPDAVMISHSEFAYRLLPWVRFQFPALPILDFCHLEEEHWQNGGYPRLSLNAQKHLDLTLVSSAHLQKWMTDRGAQAGRVSICYTRIDTQAWQPNPETRRNLREQWGIAPDLPVILFAGRMVEQKRPMRVVETLNLLKGSDRFIALLAGDGPLLGQVRAFIQKHGLQGCVRVMGYVPAQNMRDLMSSCDILFLPSANEGISLTIYEAMAMGLVPVSADVGGQRELVTSDCGVLLSSDQDATNAYANALRGLISQPEKRIHMAQNARARAEAHFGIHQLGDDLERAIEQAKANHAAAQDFVSQEEAEAAQKNAARFAWMQRARAVARHAPGASELARVMRRFFS